MVLKHVLQIKIIEHARAKRLRLRVISASNARLTVPKGCGKAQIDAFLKESTPWLEQMCQTFPQHGFPTHLTLFDVDVPLSIRLVQQKKQFDLQDNQLFLNEQCPEIALKAFVLTYAKDKLPSFFAQVAQQTQLSYTHLQIRYVKSRWGSCNQQHKIMLNALLVTLPPEVVRYVCVHELAHTVHFNHSVEFWHLVEQYHPQWKKERQYLKGYLYPMWFY